LASIEPISYPDNPGDNESVIELFESRELLDEKSGNFSSCQEKQTFRTPEHQKSSVVDVTESLIERP